MAGKEMKDTLTATFISSNGEDRIEIRKKKVGQEPPYIKVYLQDIMYLSDLSGRFVALMISLLKRANYADDERPMCVALVPDIKNDIMKECDWTSVGTLNNAINALINGGLVKRVGRGLIQLNPNLFGIGRWEDIAKIRLSVEYSPTNKRTFQAVINEKAYWGAQNKED